jgi:hypothetical protein
MSAVEDKPELNNDQDYWRQQCSLDGDCGFKGCEPPKQRYQYYDGTIPVTWEPKSREEQLTQKLESLYYQRFLLDGTLDSTQHCSCEYCDTVISTTPQLIEESSSLEIEFNTLLKARVETSGEYSPPRTRVN